MKNKLSLLILSLFLSFSVFAQSGEICCLTSPVEVNALIDIGYKSASDCYANGGIKTDSKLCSKSSSLKCCLNFEKPGTIAYVLQEKKCNTANSIEVSTQTCFQPAYCYDEEIKDFSSLIPSVAADCSAKNNIVIDVASLAMTMQQNYRDICPGINRSGDALSFFYDCVEKSFADSKKAGFTNPVAGLPGKIADDIGDEIGKQIPKVPDVPGKIKDGIKDGTDKVGDVIGDVIGDIGDGIGDIGDGIVGGVVDLIGNDGLPKSFDKACEASCRRQGQTKNFKCCPKQIQNDYASYADVVCLKADEFCCNTEVLKPSPAEPPASGMAYKRSCCGGPANKDEQPYDINKNKCCKKKLISTSECCDCSGSEICCESTSEYFHSFCVNKADYEVQNQICQLNSKKCGGSKTETGDSSCDDEEVYDSIVSFDTPIDCQGHAPVLRPPSVGPSTQSNTLDCKRPEGEGTTSQCSAGSKCMEVEKTITSSNGKVSRVATTVECVAQDSPPDNPFEPIDPEKACCVKCGSSESTVCCKSINEEKNISSISCIDETYSQCCAPLGLVFNPNEQYCCEAETALKNKEECCGCTKDETCCKPQGDEVGGSCVNKKEKEKRLKECRKLLNRCVGNGFFSTINDISCTKTGGSSGDDTKDCLGDYVPCEEGTNCKEELIEGIFGDKYKAYCEPDPSPSPSESPSADPSPTVTPEVSPSPSESPSASPSESVTPEVSPSPSESPSPDPTTSVTPEVSPSPSVSPVGTVSPSPTSTLPPASEEPADSAPPNDPLSFPQS